jgi:hypothetical protein
MFGVAAFACLAAPPRPAEAQQPRTIRLCYDPGGSGVVPSQRARNQGEVYLIGEPGLPNQCRERSHVQLSWTTGPAGATGSAAGDLTGAFPGPQVTALRGRPVANVQPQNGQVLGWDQGSSTWRPINPPTPTPPQGGQGNAAQRCPPGAVMVGLNANGGITCERPATCTGNEPVPHLIQVTFAEGAEFGLTAPAVAFGTFDLPCSFLQSDGTKPGNAVSNFTLQVGSQTYDQGTATRPEIQGVAVRGGRVVGLGANFVQAGTFGRPGAIVIQMGPDGRVVSFVWERGGQALTARPGGQMIARFER